MQNARVMKAPLQNLIAGILLAGLGVWIWVYTNTFPSLQEGYPGPALFPRLIALGLVLAGLSFVVGSLRRIAEIRDAIQQPRPAWSGLARLVLGVGLVVLYPLVQTWLGFIPTISLLSFVVAYVLKARLVVAAATALLSALVIYWLFTGVLGVPLS